MQEKRSHLVKDPALSQSEVLDYVLKNNQQPNETAQTRVSVSEARRGETQVDFVSQRTNTRILFISQDATLLNQATKSLDGYLDVADMFNEVHIIVLQPGIRTQHPVLRVAENVWVYVASATHAWWTPVIALGIIRDNMVFAGGFRPDLIIARDCYESALTAYITARRFKRPTQLHVLNDQSLTSSTNEPRSFIWRHLSAWLVSTFLSIRTTTLAQKDALSAQYPLITDIAQLPKFHNFVVPTESTSRISMKDIYKEFAFIILYAGPLTAGRKTYQAIDAVRDFLRNPRVGFVILGDGPGKNECLRRVELLGMTQQVVFEKRTELLDDYIATADVVIVTDTDFISEDIVLQAAVSGRPLVIAKTSARADLFIDGESALFFAEGDTVGATRQLHRVLDDLRLRRTLSESVSDVAATRINDDPVVYQELYKNSIEQALLVADDESNS